VPTSFIDELRRRRVLQTVGLYVVGAWVVLQVADLAFESWGLPDAALRPLWIAAIGLFPLALFFGWRYDITLQGIERTPSSVADATAPLQKLDYGIIGVILVAFAATAILAFEQATQMTAEPDLAAAADIDPRSIAVLPFVARGSEDETTFFADGVHDDLLTTLANVSDLKVISRTSVLQYRGSDKNLRQIGQELGAANVLEGGIQHVGGQVRINVQLIDAGSDEHIWAQTYDRPLSIENLFAIQSEITETIAAELAATLSAEERARVRRDRTTNLEAFAAFNRGKQLFYRATFDSLQQSADEFRKAVEIDPDYVLARIWLAGAILMQANTGALSFEEAIGAGRPHIDRAIELDPENGFALAIVGYFEWAIGNPSDNYFEHALASSPGDVMVLDTYASYLRDTDRAEQALPYIERALDLDPLSTTLYHDLGRALISLGRFEEATSAFDRISQIDSGNPYAAHGSAVSTIMSGQLAAAAYWSVESGSFDPKDPENPATTALIHMSLGDVEKAQEQIDLALELGPQDPLPLAVKAYFLTVNDRPDEAVSVARAALASQLDDRWNSHNYLLRVLRDAGLRAGDTDESLAWYRQLHPELFEEDPELNPWLVTKAADLGLLLQEAGHAEQARELLEKTVAAYDANYNRGSANFPMGIAKVDALALLGRRDEAVEAMQQLIDDGWRIIWRWSTVYNPNHESLRDDPAYEAMLSEIEQDLARQVEEFSGMELR
jgi:TolB-like protein/Tfp pilus assembly protein PilF